MVGVIFGRATSDFAGLCSRVPRMGDVYPLKLYLGHFGESWRETEIQKRGDLRGRLRGGKCGKPMYIKGKINGRNYWGHTGPKQGNPCFPLDISITRDPISRTRCIEENEEKSIETGLVRILRRGIISKEFLTFPLSPLLRWLFLLNISIFRNSIFQLLFGICPPSSPSSLFFERVENDAMENEQFEFHTLQSLYSDIYIR